MKKLENDSSSITIGNKRLVPKQLLYETLKPDGFPDDNIIKSIIDSLIHKDKIYNFRHKNDGGGGVFYGVKSEECDNNDDEENGNDR